MSAFVGMAGAVQDAHARSEAWVPTPNGPPEHQRQFNMLERHTEFINSMGCCNTKDGRGDLEEIPNDGSDARFPLNSAKSQKDYPYIVLMTHDLNGKQLDKPTPIWIPADKILSVETARAKCKPKLIENPDSTCTLPNFPVLFVYDNSDSKVYQDGDVPHQMDNFYCYYRPPEVE
jgi:hypothetical protein